MDALKSGKGRRAFACGVPTANSCLRPLGRLLTWIVGAARMRWFLGIGCVASSLFVSGLGSGADAQFHGDTITIEVGFSPGGGYDAYARVFARYLGRHVPDNPRVIVENMPGASSLKAIKYLDADAPKDGSVITAFNPGLITESLVDPSQVKFNFTSVAWVGSITRDERICYAWGKTGIKTFAELERAKQFTLGAPAPGTSSYISAEILKKIFGVRVREVMGYPGSAEQRLAIERGELDGDCGSFSSIPPDWISQKKINPLLRFSPSPIAGLADDVPFIVDLAEKPEIKSLLRVLIAPDEVGRPYVVSKATPKARLSELRAAFEATVQDPDFLAEMNKMALPVVFPADGDKAEQIVQTVYATSPDIILKARTMLPRQ